MLVHYIYSCTHLILLAGPIPMGSWACIPC